MSHPITNGRRHLGFFPPTSKVSAPLTPQIQTELICPFTSVLCGNVRLFSEIFEALHEAGDPQFATVWRVLNSCFKISHGLTFSLLDFRQRATIRKKRKKMLFMAK